MNVPGQTNDVAEMQKEETDKQHRFERLTNQNLELQQERIRTALEVKLNEKRLALAEQTNLVHLITDEIENLELDLESKDAVIKIGENNEKKKTAKFEQYLFTAKASTNFMEERENMIFQRKEFEVS